MVPRPPMVHERVEPDSCMLWNVRIVERPRVVSAEVASPLDDQHAGIGPMMRDRVRQQTALQAAADENVVNMIGTTHAPPPHAAVRAACWRCARSITGPDA